jgi:hypothetical protein
MAEAHGLQMQLQQLIPVMVLVLLQTRFKLWPL